MLCQLRLLCFAAAVAAAVQVASVGFDQEPEPRNSVVVHEWGTFTSLHDELGRSICGINSDDEPVPEFVHRVARQLLLSASVSPPALFQGAPRCHPDVRMRLETPVVYFHLADGAKKPLTLNVEVAFRAGWLSEYYPNAKVQAPGINGDYSFGPISTATVGRLEWNDLQVGTNAFGPETTAQVWLSPRAVDAANVTSADGESERFLFYRGVGRVDSPLRVSRDESGESLTITADFPFVAQSKEVDIIVPALWLVNIRDDKSCAFREIDGIQVPNDGKRRIVATTTANFNEPNFHSDNIDDLCSAMRTSLIADGLFEDEADALLNTWKASYFESPGLRLFYLLPREWTDHVLPMQLSVDAKLVRTMVGRVEIVTPDQRRLLRRIAAGPASNARWLHESLNNSGATPPVEPEDYKAYGSLGRFRNALVLDELKRRPTPALQAFVEGYGVHGYVPTGK